MVKGESPYGIRWAHPQEWDDVMMFVWNVFMQSHGKRCTDEGRDSFYRFIADPELRDSFLKGEYPVLTARADNVIIGAAAIRYRNHLSLLFVDQDHRRKGIGKALVNAAVEYAKGYGERYMSVRAVSDAVNFYRKLGFHGVRPEEEFAGIKATDMERVF